MLANEHVAMLLVGHGSRAQEANDGMYRVLDAVRLLGQYPIVEAGFMGLNPPTIEDGAAACVAKGAKIVLMMPYFLHTGMHIQQDLPAIVQRLRQEYPDTKFALGEPLGYDPRLVDVVVERATTCRETVIGNGNANGNLPT